MMSTNDPSIIVEELCVDLLNALEAFDRSIPPYGLYASDELVSANPERHYHQAWHRGLKPYLKARGAEVPDSRMRSPTAYFKMPDIGLARVMQLTISKIKVRQYGSRYYLDKHKAYDERWAESKIAKAISTLWKLPGANDTLTQLGLVLLIGYDKAARPFERELNRQHASLKWEKRDVQYHTKIWEDIYARGFRIRTSIWAKYAESGVAGR